jgi:hypothetical protein
MPTGTVQAQSAPGLTAAICGKPASRPHLISLTCNGFPFLADLAWKTWGPATAVAFGYFELDGCKPDCADGKIYKVPTAVELYDVKASSFTELEYTDAWSKPVKL